MRQSRYLLIKVMFIIFGSFILLPLADAQNNVAKKEEIAKAIIKKHPAQTALSKKAEHLAIGMRKKQVIKLLGKPTWADIDVGVPLTLAWRNGDCNPVIVTFDEHMRVNGWDEGRAECLATAYMDLPDNKYLCTNSDRKDMCAVKSIA